MTKTLAPFFLILMLVSFPALCRADSQDEAKQNNSNPPTILEDSLNPIPVKVTGVEKQKDGTAVINAHFASDLVVDWYMFLLPSNVEQRSFFKKGSGYQEEVDRSKFIKIAKDNYWLIWWYLKDGMNVIHKAFQFKNWGDLKSSFAQNTDNVEESVDSPTYWKFSKTKTLRFHDANFPENKVYWMKIEKDEKPLTDEETNEIEKIEDVINEFIKSGTKPFPGDVARKLNLPEERILYLLRTERVTLANGQIRTKRFKFSDGTSGIIKSCGMFTIHPGCVFSTIETKESKGLPIIGSPTLKIKPIMSTRKYFEENFQKSDWVCFYNFNTMVLLRASPIILEDSQDKKDKK